MRGRLLHRKSLSEPDVRGHLAATGPPISVDELWRWRRRRAPQPPPSDSLQPFAGSMAEVQTEYRYRYGNWPPLPSPPPQPPIFGAESTEHGENFIKFTHIRRSNLRRRPTNLFLEGDFDFETEFHKAFREFPVTPRIIPPRPRTTLSPEGRLEFVTESRNQYHELLLSPRPKTRRPRSSLIAEGDVDFLTESMKEFREFKLPPKEEITRPKTNLIIEGSFEFLTESKEEFSQMFGRPKAVTSRRSQPPIHLKNKNHSGNSPRPDAPIIESPQKEDDSEKEDDDKNKNENTENNSKQMNMNINELEISKPHRPIYLDPEFMRPPPSPPTPSCPPSRLAQVHRVTAIVPPIYPPPPPEPLPRLSRPRRRIGLPNYEPFDYGLTRPRRVVRIAPQHLDSYDDSSTVTSDDLLKYRSQKSLQRPYIPNSLSRHEMESAAASAFVVLDANNNRCPRNLASPYRAKEGRSPSEPGRWMAPWYQTT